MILARTAAASSVLGLVLGFAALAGDLAPPAGPIAPTAKPLSEVEPRIALSQENTPGNGNCVFRITAPGSYYLTADLVGAGSAGIEVGAPDVTIDLNGFAVLASQTSDGIGYDSSDGDVPPVRLTVRNGRVTAFNYGVSAGPGSVLERLQCTNTFAWGLRVGDGGIVRDCVVYNSDIRVGAGGVVERCVARGNVNGSGIKCNSGSRIVDCVSINNQTAGIESLLFTESVLIEGCFVAGNVVGISISGTGHTVVRNVAKGNTSVNYSFGAGNHVGAIVSDPALAGPWDNLSN